MSSPSSSEPLNGLTDVQKSAAAWNDGALLLLAGPGSGKTRVLTARVIRLLSESPEARWRIAALTFTTRAGDEMRQRILAAMPDAEERLFVGTFHSFACELLRQSGTHVQVRTDFNIYSDDRDRLLLLRSALEAGDVNYEGALDRLLPVIDRMRDRLAGPDECAQYLKDPSRADLFATLYRAYEQFLQRENVLDFPGLIYSAFKLLSQYPGIAEKYRKSFRYIHVDEFQDTNSAQYRFLRALTGDSYNNIFVVADDDQIIYQWNGASHKRLDDFRRDYAPEVFQMPTNFRCPEEVVVLANKLVSHNALRSPGKQPLIAGKSCAARPDRVRVLSFDDEQLEAAAIASEIAGCGHPLRTIAVIARTKALLEKAQNALREKGIAARLAQRRDEFVSKPFQALQLALELSNRPADRPTFNRFVSTMNVLLRRDDDPDDLAAQVPAAHADYLSSWCNRVQEEPLPERELKLVQEIVGHLGERRDFRRFLRAWGSWLAANRQSLEEEHSGIDEDDRAWRDLSREINLTIGSDAGLEAFLQELHLRSKEPTLGPDELPLLTIHGAKGNEFDHVYLMGLAEDVLPSYQSRQMGANSPQMEEERRNCFVAITRCMETLTISFARQYRGYRKQPSRFLAEMELDGPAGAS